MERNYQARLRTAREALAGVRRGQRVFIGSGAAKPQALVEALTDRAAELADTEIVHLLTLGDAPYSDARFDRAFRHNALFIGANVRSAVREGRADYTPVFLSEIPRLFKSRRLPLDVALVQVSPPDTHGFCSLGVSVDIVLAAVESAATVIAEVNSMMPRTMGNSFVHVDRLAALVESQRPIPEGSDPSPDDVARAIGRHVADLVEDGATLQMGIGSIPNAVLSCLGDKRDLGVHTEMFSDGLLPLIRAGVITGAQKKLNRGRIVSSFCIGSRELYDAVDANPLFEFHPVDYTNDPFVIAQNPRVVAINAAIEVDLTGQVCADSIGASFYSGIGGQVDFIRGAARSVDGRPIIVLRSTAGDGSISRIVPSLREGAGVVTTRGDVHFVVTEYGVADLWGRSARERAIALIEVAHPDHREALLAEASRRRLIGRSYIVTAPALYPQSLECEVTARDGTAVLFRPLRATDEALIRRLFYSCSDDTIYRRFFIPLRQVPDDELRRLLNVDYRNTMGVAGVVEENAEERMVAIGYYDGPPGSTVAEVDVLVADDYQNRGIGTLMMHYLTGIARDAGYTAFHAEVVQDDELTQSVLSRCGFDIERTQASGVVSLMLNFPPAPTAPLVLQKQSE